MSYFEEVDGRNAVTRVSPYKARKSVDPVYTLIAESRGLKTFVKTIKKDSRLSEILRDIRVNCFISSFKTPEAFLDCCKELAREFKHYDVIDSKTSFTVFTPYGRLEFDLQDRSYKIYKKANPL